MINNEKKTKFLKAREVAEEFFDGKIGYIKVLKLTKEGVLPAKRIGKIYFYTLDALNDWAEKNMGTPAWKKLTK